MDVTEVSPLDPTSTALTFTIEPTPAPEETLHQSNEQVVKLLIKVGVISSVLAILIIAIIIFLVQRQKKKKRAYIQRFPSSHDIEAQGLSLFGPAEAETNPPPYHPGKAASLRQVSPIKQSLQRQNSARALEASDKKWPTLFDSENELQPRKAPAPRQVSPNDKSLKRQTLKRQKSALALAKSDEKLPVLYESETALHTREPIPIRQAAPRQVSPITQSLQRQKSALALAESDKQWPALFGNENIYATISVAGEKTRDSIQYPASLHTTKDKHATTRIREIQDLEEDEFDEAPTRRRSISQETPNLDPQTLADLRALERIGIWRDIVVSTPQEINEAPGYFDYDDTRASPRSSPSRAGSTRRTGDAKRSNGQSYDNGRPRSDSSTEGRHNRSPRMTKHRKEAAISAIGMRTPPLRGTSSSYSTLSELRSPTKAKE